MLSVLRFTASDYSVGVLWSLWCLSFDLRLLVTPVVYCDHCVVCPLIYGFWLLLWYLLVIVLSVLWFTASDYSFGVFWPLCCLSFDLRLLITLLVSCVQCVVSPVIYGFCWLLWCLVVSVVSALWLFTASDYSFGVLWSVCCLSCDLRLLITPVVYCGHCVVCPLIYGFWLLLWYLLVIVLSVLRFTASDYSFGVFWSLCCLSFDLRLQITLLVSCGHCGVCPSIYGFWLLLWCLLVIVLSILWFTASGYSCGVLWSLCCLSFDLRLLVTPLVSFSHCVVCPSIYGFWLLLWCLLVIVLSVLWFTASDYSFGVFWPLSCLSFDLRLLITLLVSCVQCVVSPVIYGFCWLLWCLVVSVVSALWLFTASDYSFGVLWSVCCLSCDLRLLITHLMSFGHCVVCPVIYGFWLLLWCLVVIVLSVLWFTASNYSFGILWSLRCLSCALRLLITPMMSFGHCVVCPVIYGFWLLLWYLVVIMLSVLWFTVSGYSFGVLWSLLSGFRITASDYSFGVLWPLCCLSFDVRLLITPLVSFGHCVVCPVIYGFWLLLWYIVVIVLSPVNYGFWLLFWWLVFSVLSVLWFTASDDSFGVLCSVWCLSCDYLRLLVTHLVSFGQCGVCHLNYGFWLLLWCLVVIVLSVLWFTASDYSFGILWSLRCLSCDLRLLITPLMYFGHCVVCPVIYGFWLLLWCLLVIMLSVLWFTASGYSFGILWWLYCFFIPVIYSFWLLLWCLLVIVLSVLWFTASGYSVGVLWSLCCLAFDLRFWLLLWCLLVIVLSVLRCTASDYSLCVFWSLCCLSCDLRFLITPWVSCGHCVVSCELRFWLLLWCLFVIVLSVLWFTASGYSVGVLWSLCCLSCDLRFLITPLVSLGHWVVCPLFYGFWLLPWYLVVIELSVLWFTASDYSFGILWPLSCLSFDLRFMITPLVSCGHWVVCPLIYGFWLLIWCLLVIVLSVLWFTASDYSFGILWSLYCLSCDLRLLITPLVSCGHWVVCPLIYGFWLLLWCLLVMVLSVLGFAASDYSFGILWLLSCLSFDLRLLVTPLMSCGHWVVCPVIYGFWLLFGVFWSLCCLSCDLRLLITPLVSFGHWGVCPVIYVFWLLLWCIVVIELSVLWFTASDYSFGILWSLSCLSCDLRLLITPLVSCGHWVVCPFIYGFRLLLWYLVVIELSVLWFTASDYSFGIFFSLSCLSFDLRLLVTPLMYCGHWVVCPLIYGFGLLLWCVVVIELSVLWFTASDYSFGVLWSLNCLSFDLRLLITPLVCCGHWVVCPLIYGFWLLLWFLVVIELSVLWFTASDYSFGVLWSLNCLSFDLRFWLLLWCVVVIELSVLWFTASDYSFGVLWSLNCLSFDLRLLITPLVSCGHWVVCPLIYGFWLLLWCLVVIYLPVLWLTTSDYSFDVLWSLSCLSFDLRFLITLLVSCGHWVVCPLIYSFWLLLWCLVVIELSVLWFTASDYCFGVLWSLSCLSFDLRLLITPLVSGGHWVVCPLIYSFWLLLWCLVVIELSVLWFTASDYSVGVLWSLSCLPFDLRLLITPLVSFGHWVVCPLIYGFWLLRWCLVVIELSALWFTASDYSFGVFWSLSCLSFDLQLLITLLVFGGHWVVCPLIYGFWLLLWCIVVIELSVLWFTASDYSFGVLELFVPQSDNLLWLRINQYFSYNLLHRAWKQQKSVFWTFVWSALVLGLNPWSASQSSITPPRLFFFTVECSA